MLKIFSSIKKEKKNKTPNKEVILKAGHKLFGHMVLITTSRKLSMQEVLQDPISPLPWSLANCDGTMKKTNKATLGRKLEKKVSSAQRRGSPSVTVIDGMSLIQKVHGENSTFAELSAHVFALGLQTANESQ